MNSEQFPTTSQAPKWEATENPQAYAQFHTVYSNPTPKRHELGLVGGNNVSQIAGNMIDLESDLRGITRINTTTLPTHLDQGGNFNDELFWKKFNRVLKFPFHMLASIGVHYYWFDVRVRKLFVAERLKNG